MLWLGFIVSILYRYRENTVKGKHDLRRGLGLPFSLIVSLLLLLLLSAGCSSKGSVTGKVLYQGKPLPGGTVTFFCGSRGTFTSPIKEDGTYSVDKVRAGDAKIGVENQSLNRNRGAIPKMPGGYKEKFKSMIPEDVDASEMMPGFASSLPGKYVPIPEHYSDPEKSGLTYTVTGGQQSHDIELK